MKNMKSIIMKIQLIKLTLNDKTMNKLQEDKYMFF